MSDNDIEIGEKVQDEHLIKYICDLSKEMNVEGAHGIVGNELELIALVRNCPFLYDKNLSDFKDTRKKNVVWSAIASVLHCKVHEVKQRWRSLRETYNRYKKDIEQQDGESICSWEYYEDMKFIEPFIHHRSKMPKAQGSENDDDSNDETCQASEIIQFILTVKSRPILYDNNHPHYKTKELKVEVWNEVAEETNLTVTECEQKWRNLRERYGRERKMRHSHNNRKKWEYFDVLSFLDVHIKPRRHSSYRPILPKVDDNTNNLAIISPMNNHVSSNNTAFLLKHLDMSPTSNESKQDRYDLQHVEFVEASNTPKSSNTSTTNVSKVHCKESPINSVEHHIVIHDEDELFGQSISAELRRIPSGKKKMKIKAEIYKILYENESDN